MIHAVDLGLIGSEESLVRQVFAGPRWEEWREGKVLTVFLDALDECRVSVQHAAQVLVREFCKLQSLEQLRLRIACRPGAWPEYLENRLGKLWPDNVTALNLAPLRRQDAEEIARFLGVSDPAAFLDAVRRAEAGPLATSPLTLRLLARLQSERGSIPSRRLELYEQGCLALSTEQNPSRRAARRTGTFSVHQRLAIAGRLAALTVLCGKTGVWLGTEALRPGPEWLTVSEVAGGTERAVDQSFAVTDAAVREVLEDTAFFTALDAEQVRWVHRSYTEFLAARHLLTHDVPLAQLRQLLWHPAKPDRIVPQLLGVVGWLGRVSGLFQVVCQTDPQALFRTDLTEAGDEERRLAVEVVLLAVEAGQLSDNEFGAVQYRRLAHSGLPAQLRPLIVNKAASRPTRCLALDLARVCCVKDVSAELVAISLDETDELMIRCLAASTLCRRDDPALRAQLRPLLDKPLTEDRDDDLKGYALLAVWPHALSAVELFAKLTPPKRPNYFGSYSRFIHNNLLAKLRDEDLPIALRWTTELSRELSARGFLKELCDQVLLQAWKSPHFSTLIPELARAVWANIDRHERGLGQHANGIDVERFGEDDEKRRELLAALLPLTAADRKKLWFLQSFRPRVVRRTDIPWLLHQLDVISEPGQRAVLLELVMMWFNASDAEHLDKFLDTAERHLDLKALLDPYVAPVELGSEMAEHLRRVYATNIAREKQDAERDSIRIAVPSAQERIRADLEQFEAGIPGAWCELVRDLSIGPNSRFGTETLQADLTTFPGWQESDVATRGRILIAAREFVSNQLPHVEQWFKEDRHPPEEGRAGFKALRLLQKEDKLVFESFEDRLWERWLPFLLTYPSSGYEEDEKAQQGLLAIAYRKCPGEFLSWLRRCILRDNGFIDVVVQRCADGTEAAIRHETPTRILRSVSAFYDKRMAAVLRPFLADPEINSAVYGNLLDELLAHKDIDATKHAHSLLRQRVPVGEIERQKYRVTLQVMTERLPGEVWPVLGALSTTQPDVCRDLFKNLADFSPSEAALRLNAQMTEQQVAELYQVLTTLFFTHAAGGVGDQDENVSHRLRHFRSEVLRYLCARGTFEAVAAIDALGKTMPGMHYARLDAERRALEDSWEPPEPGELTSLMGDAERRLIRSGEELLAVIRESFGRLERELQGETRLNFILWDERANGLFRPKDEERLSDVIKQHLVRDLKGRGLIAHREVQIRSKQGQHGVPGEETDIYVDVLVPLPGRDQLLRIRVIIEVKGCWHKDLLTAMETQLRDRYLRDNDCRHGLYLVGWFICPQWDGTDQREKKSRSQMPATIDAARLVFEDQAARLSEASIILKAEVLNVALR